jgi:hypothetical protein
MTTVRSRAKTSRESWLVKDLRKTSETEREAIVSMIAGITRRRRFGAGVSGDAPKGASEREGNEKEYGQ